MDLIIRRRGEAMKAAREALGWSQAKLAEAAGTTQQTIDRLEKAEIGASRFEPIILDLLGLSISESSMGAGAFNTPAQVKVDRNAARPTAGLPVYQLYRYGVQAISDRPVDMLERPPFLRNVTGAYAVIVLGSEMAPAFRPGDLALINPLVPVRPDNEVLFRSGTGQNAEIRTLIAQDPRGWDVKSWSPERIDRFERTQMLHAHAVAGKIARI